MIPLEVLRLTLRLLIHYKSKWIVYQVNRKIGDFIQYLDIRSSMLLNPLPYELTNERDTSKSRQQWRH